MLVVVAAFAAGAMSHYRWLKELEERISRLERKNGMEGIRTLEYRQEDAEAELRKDAELGRKARIAAEVLSEFLDDRRESIIQCLENDIFTTDNIELADQLAELRVMKSFRGHCEYLKQRGEIAEEELRNGE